MPAVRLPVSDSALTRVATPFLALVIAVQVTVLCTLGLGSGAPAVHAAVHPPATRVTSGAAGLHSSDVNTGQVVTHRRAVSGTRRPAVPRHPSTPSAQPRGVAVPTPTSKASSGAPATADTFVTRSGSRLQLGTQPFKVTGVNAYWLGLDDNVTDAGGATYPAHSAVDSAFRSAVGVGARLVRSISLGVSVGSPRSLEPTLGTFNDAAFGAIDYAVADARRYGVRLMIPLSDEWHYYGGGKHTFTDWTRHADVPGQTSVTSSAQRAAENYFYTDPRTISAFHAYVRHLLDHVNPLTGLRLGSDPTIAIWETGNELWDAPPSWTASTATFIKSLAPHSLVADGSAASGKDITETAYTATDVDIVDGHFYPTDAAKATHDADFVAAHGKAYMVGEYPLTGSDLQVWLSTLAGNPHVVADLAWSLLPWLADGTAERHDDGYTFHYPGASTAESREVSLLQAHAVALPT